MNIPDLVNFFKSNITVDQQKFLLEFMKTYLNSGKKVKEAVIKILENVIEQEKEQQ